MNTEAAGDTAVAMTDTKKARQMPGLFGAAQG